MEFDLEKLGDVNLERLEEALNFLSIPDGKECLQFSAFCRQSELYKKFVRVLYEQAKEKKDSRILADCMFFAGVVVGIALRSDIQGNPELIN